MQVAQTAARSESISLRKHSLDLAGMQLASSTHNGPQIDTALAIIKAGKTVKVSYVGTE